ncbi:MAG: GNAT family N-acetyltransferase [Anaerolineales bacterium]
MQIRNAVAADANSIARVHVTAWQEAYRGILPEAFLASLSVERRQEMWTTVLAGTRPSPGNFVLADESSTIVGFSSAGRAREPRGRFEGELYAIYLLASFHGKGFGRSLFRAAAESLLQSGVGSMMLWVLKDNPTRGFYEHLGGVVDGEQSTEIGTQPYLEIAYGWPDLSRWFRDSAATGVDSSGT